MRFVKKSINWWQIALIIWILFLSVCYSTLSIVRHNSFQSGAFDLGLYDQSVWQYAHGLYPFNTVKNRFILGDHLTLTLPFIAPLFYLWDDVRILLVFQAIVTSCSAYAVFALAKRRKFSSFVSFAFAFMYSLFYGIQFAVFFDFHPVVFGVALLPFIAYLTETSHRKLQILAILFFLLTQENMGIGLASLGCIYFFKKQFKTTGIVYIVIGLTASLIGSRIVGWLSPTGFEYVPRISMNPIQIIQQLFDAPEKKQVWLYSFAWFSFLPIFQ
jgi:uncharacterized membrane protein